MKKYLGLLVVLVLAVVLNTGAARAENAGGTTSTDDGFKMNWGQAGNKAREEMKEKREALRTKIQTVREQAKEKFGLLKDEIKKEKDAAKAKIKELRITGRERALERFDNAVARIGVWEDKVNEAIDKFEDKGLNVTEAKAFVDTADSKLTDAKEKIAEMNTLLAKSTGQLTAEDKTSLRKLAQETQTLIVEAHKALKDAVKSLRDQVKTKMEEEKSDKTEKNDEDSEDNDNDQ